MGSDLMPPPQKDSVDDAIRIVTDPKSPYYVRLLEGAHGGSNGAVAGGFGLGRVARGAHAVNSCAWTQSQPCSSNRER